MKKYLFGLVVLFGAIAAQNLKAQPINDTITTAHWNLYRWSSGANTPANPDRVGHARRAVKYINPDIFTANEMTGSASITHFLNNVLNTRGENRYSSAPFLSGGSDTHNGMFYRNDKFVVLAQGTITTRPRNVTWYRMLYLPSVSGVRRDSVILTYFVLHPKASNTTQDEIERTQTAGAVMGNIALTPANIYRNRIMQADLNVYSNTASSYVAYTSTANANRFVDVNNNNFGLRINLTQSPRVSNFDGGVPGGLDNRFDFILFQPQILTTGADRVRYIDGSYRAIGNDGTDFNNADLNSRPNLIYPDSVVNGVYFGSDHLPVTAKLALNMRCFEATIASRNDSLIAQPANLREYFWYRNGVLAATTPTNVFVPNVDGRFGYTVKIRNAAGCFDSSRAIFVTHTPALSAEEFIVFPNPANNVVKFSASNGLEMVSIQLTDVAGRLISTIPVQASEFSLNVAVLAKGLYFAKINTAKGAITKRLVIE